MTGRYLVPRLNKIVSHKPPVQMRIEFLRIQAYRLPATTNSFFSRRVVRGKGRNKGNDAQNSKQKGYSENGKNVMTEEQKEDVENY
jgi:hypothetical protein